MKNEYWIDSLREENMEQVIELFCINYKKYHYTQLTNKGEINRLVTNSKFQGIALCKGKDVIGFAGYYIEESEYPIVIKLSHLLVSSEYRGMGLGRLLEEERLRKIRRYEKEFLIYASCVEKPMYSYFLKKSYGFNICGIRLGYRPGDDCNRDNAIIMVLKKYCENVKKVIEIEEPCDITKRLILNGNSSVLFSQKSIRSEKQIRYSYNRLVNIEVGRCEYALYIDEHGKRIEEIIEDMLKESVYYVSVNIRPDIVGFSNIDAKLCSNKIYPLSYIPYAGSYLGMLEYQVLKEHLEKTVIDASEESKCFLEKLYKMDFCYK